jgi:hypothetical protein
VRELADAERIRRFMRALGLAARTEGACYLTGGATAVLIGWRQATVDVDIRLVPDDDALLRHLPRLKDELRLNVELASPPDFVPVRPGWEGRSVFVAREGQLTFYHFDLEAQALAKLERGHARDLADVGEMAARKLIDAAALEAAFTEIEAELYRYPAIDPGAFRSRVAQFARARARRD